MSTCPGCDGKGENTGFVNTGMDSGKHYFGTIKCPDCQGSGDIPGRTEETIAEGKRIKRERVMAGMTLGAMADRMGISAAALSKIERGIPTNG